MVAVCPHLAPHADSNRRQNNPAIMLSGTGSRALGGMVMLRRGAVVAHDVRRWVGSPAIEAFGRLWTIPCDLIDNMRLELFRFEFRFLPFPVGVGHVDDADSEWSYLHDLCGRAYLGSSMD